MKLRPLHPAGQALGPLADLVGAAIEPIANVEIFKTRVQWVFSRRRLVGHAREEQA